MMSIRQEYGTLSNEESPSRQRYLNFKILKFLIGLSESLIKNFMEQFPGYNRENVQLLFHNVPLYNFLGRKISIVP